MRILNLSKACFSIKILCFLGIFKFRTKSNIFRKVPLTDAHNPYKFLLPLHFLCYELTRGLHDINFCIVQSKTCRAPIQICVFHAAARFYYLPPVRQFKLHYFVVYSVVFAMQTTPRESELRQT